MLIAIDIGNSSITVGYFTGPDPVVQTIGPRPSLMSQGYVSLFNTFIKENNIDKTPEGIIISSVVPDLTGVLRQALKEFVLAAPLILDSSTETGIRLAIPNPEELGSDRIANAVAAYELCGCPVAVVDFGTATTISVVGPDANYIGGAIMPGIGLMNKALASGTSKLSEVAMDPPATALGTRTDGCIRAGLFYGTAGSVERLLAEMERECGFPLRVLITGGHSVLLSRFLNREHEVRPRLTLEGLRIIYMRNMNA